VLPPYTRTGVGFSLTIGWSGFAFSARAEGSHKLSRLVMSPTGNEAACSMGIPGGTRSTTRLGVSNQFFKTVWDIFESIVKLWQRAQLSLLGDMCWMNMLGRQKITQKIAY
jgi:hypothetical protein